eukprot:s2779_g3.t1
MPYARAGDTQEQSAVADTLPDTLPASESQVEGLKGNKPKTKAKQDNKKPDKDKKDGKKEKAGKPKSKKNLKKAKKEGKKGGKRKSAKAEKLKKEKKRLKAAKKKTMALSSKVVRNLHEELAAAASPETALAAAPVPKKAKKAPAEQAPQRSPVEKAPEQAPAKKAPEQAPAEKALQQAPVEKAPQQAPAEKAPQQAPVEKAPQQAPAERASEKAPETAQQVPVKMEPEIGRVYLSNASWEGALRKLMVGEDFRLCVVEPFKGGRTFYFANENCVLDKVPERSEFPLRVLRAPHKAKGHAVQAGMQHVQKEPSECDSDEAKKLAEEDRHLEEIVSLTEEQLQERVNQAVKHPLFAKYIKEVVEIETPNQSACVKMFGQERDTAAEEVWDFEIWLKKQPAQKPQPQASSVPVAANSGPSHGVNTSEPQQEKTDKTQHVEQSKQVQANLLHPGTTDLPSPPATPIAQEIPAPSPADTVPPGEEAAEAEKAADLFEQWLTAGQDWKKSQVYINISNNVGNIDTNARDWLTLGELETKLGAEAAKSMKDFLETHKPEKCRDHPDAPGGPSNVQECRQYRVLTKDQHENRNEDWVNKSLKFQDSSGSSSSSSDDGKARGSKKTKKA